MALRVNRRLDLSLLMTRRFLWTRSVPMTRRLSFVLISGIAILNGCSSKKPSHSAPPPEVTVTPVLQKTVSIHQEWVGTMVGNTDADIRPKVEGFLLKRLYTEGSFVRKDQPMFQLDQRQAMAALEQAKGQLAQAKALLAQAQIDVNRYTPLVAERAVSQAELDKALSLEKSGHAQVQAAEATVDNAKLNLGWTTVVSPIAGIAGIAKVGIGDLMTPITQMATVSSVNPIYVDFSVSEQDYLKFARAKPSRNLSASLQLMLGDGSAYSHIGRALLINREVDSRTGTIQVRAEFPNPGNFLRPGQYARIRAVTQELNNALLVPQRSVSELQGIYQVGVVGPDKKVAIRSVQPGPQLGDMWVISSGLQANDQVVVDGLQRIRDGMTVSPKPFKDTQADRVQGE